MKQGGLSADWNCYHFLVTIILWYISLVIGRIIKMLERLTIDTIIR